LKAKYSRTSVLTIGSAMLIVMSIGSQAAGQVAGGSPYEGKSCLTAGCHANLSEPKHVHAPVTLNQCDECHRETDRVAHKFTATAEFPQMCYECHDEGAISEAAKGGSVHQPVAAGDCRSCHRDHGSEHPDLLIEAYGRDYYVPAGDSEKYALCFECHDYALIEEKETQDTKFRNGRVNLHHLHVTRERKGRSCRMCHTAHVSDQPRLIRSSVPFGKWEMKLRFAVTETGGACGPSCHAPKRYDRENPIDLTKPPEVESLLRSDR